MLGLSRNETIAANLARIDRPTLMLTGAHHLEGLERRMGLYNTREVVSFNVSGIDGLGSSHVIAPRRDASRLNDDTMLRMGLGQKEGNAFIAWAEANGKKLSNAERDRRLQHPLTATNRDPVAIEHHLDALYDAGRFPEAAAAMLQLERACSGVDAFHAAQIACLKEGYIYDYRWKDVARNLFPLPTISPLTTGGKGVVVIDTHHTAAAKQTTIPAPQKPWYSGTVETFHGIMDDVSQYLPDFLKHKSTTPQPKAPAR